MHTIYNLISEAGAMDDHAEEAQVKVCRWNVGFGRMHDYGPAAMYV